VRPFTATLSLAEARAQLEAHARPIARTDRVALTQAVGRVASSDVASTIDVPPFARSAMDGYAVIVADTVAASGSAPRRLRIVERIYTGAPPRASIVPGTCAEIATGAPLPHGADAVVMVEETTAAPDDAVDICAPATAGQNIGRRGADMAIGDLAVRAGDVLTPSRIGALAAVGRAAVDVLAQPRVAILSTGNEVVEPGGELTPGRIFDVNRFTLSAIVTMHGGIAQPHPPAHDTLDALTRAIDECADADIIVFSGGSSVGERDLIVDAVAARGEMIFHGIAVKPGKPTAFATIGGVAFFGMPGNPTSCLSNAYILLIPFLRATAGLPPHQPHTLRLPLGQRIASQAGRHQFYTVRVLDGITLPAFKGSGDITSLSRADGYIEIPADTSVVEEGALVDVTLF
jgi:molybdenum cofactor synthesis domain-containing protein